MLLLQVGTIESAVPHRSCRRRRPSRRNPVGLLLALMSCVLMTTHQAVADKGGKGKGGKKKQPTASATGSPTESSLTNIPLPIGHEAKGLVLPDFDADGHLRGRFEAGTARRIDEEHVQFSDLKIVTYTPENQPDLTIVMSKSVFDLKTRILSSQERTTVSRSDFNIIGDAVQFDTNSHTGTLTGNVKMVITDQSKFKPQNTE